jgi:hypothetical protein
MGGVRLRRRGRREPMRQLLEYAEIFLSYLVYMLLGRGGLEGCSEEPENTRPG